MKNLKKALMLLLVVIGVFLPMDAHASDGLSPVDANALEIGILHITVEAKDINTGDLANLGSDTLSVSSFKAGLDVQVDGHTAFISLPVEVMRDNESSFDVRTYATQFDTLASKLPSDVILSGLSVDADGIPCTAVTSAINIECAAEGVYYTVTISELNRNPLESITSVLGIYVNSSQAIINIESVPTGVHANERYEFKSTNKSGKSYYSKTGKFTKVVDSPTSQKTLDTLQEEYIVENNIPFKSLTDEGIVISTTLGIVIQYTDYFGVEYKGLVPTVSVGDKVSKDDIIGYSHKSNPVIVGMVFGSQYVTTNWMFSSYPMPSNGPSVPSMLQTDSRWGSKKYGSGTIASSACGPSSFAMVASYFEDKTITPESMVNQLYSLGNGSVSWCYLSGVGSYHTMFDRLSKEYGYGINVIGKSSSSLASALDKDSLVVISIKAGPIYKGAGHFIVIRGVDSNGKFYVNDPAGYFDLDRAYTRAELGTINMCKKIYKK